MKKETTMPTTIDTYIEGFPTSTKAILQKFRAAIKKAAPEVEETINYGVPTFTLNGNLVHFAAYKNHIGFYPAPSGIEAFQKELSVYKGAKGSVQFPIDEPLPLALITKIVKFRVKENEAKTKEKKTTKPVAKKSGSKKMTDEEQVQAYMSQLPKAQKNDVEAVRKMIKAASSKLKERIKWNAPSYYYKDDIVTFGPYKTHKLLLVFHHPLIVKINSTLLEGTYKDRRLTHFKDKADAEAKKKELIRILNELINMIDKK